MMMIIVVCTSFKYNLHFNQMRRGGTGNMPLWSSEQRKGGPGPKSWKQRERARPGHRPTDTPTSPIVVASSDDEAPKPKQVGTKHRVEVNDDGYAEEYAEYVGFEYKGMYIHLREIDELQNTGEPTVFRRTQEMEGDTVSIMGEVIQRMRPKQTNNTVIKSTDVNVTFTENPDDLARDIMYATLAETQMANPNRQYASIHVQTDTTCTAEASTQTEPTATAASSSDSSDDCTASNVRRSETRKREVTPPASHSRRRVVGPKMASSERSSSRSRERRRIHRQRSPAPVRNEKNGSARNTRRACFVTTTIHYAGARSSVN